jgi:hypothetical protein
MALDAAESFEAMDDDGRDRAIADASALPSIFPLPV